MNFRIIINHKIIDIHPNLYTYTVFFCCFCIEKWIRRGSKILLFFLFLVLFWLFILFQLFRTNNNNSNAHKHNMCDGFMFTTIDQMFSSPESLFPIHSHQEHFHVFFSVAALLYRYYRNWDFNRKAKYAVEHNPVLSTTEK